MVTGPKLPKPKADELFGPGSSVRRPFKFSKPFLNMLFAHLTGEYRFYTKDKPTFFSDSRFGGRFGVIPNNSDPLHFKIIHEYFLLVKIGITKTYGILHK